MDISMEMPVFDMVDIFSEVGGEGTSMALQLWNSSVKADYCKSSGKYKEKPNRI